MKPSNDSNVSSETNEIVGSLANRKVSGAITEGKPECKAALGTKNAMILD